MEMEVYKFRSLPPELLAEIFKTILWKENWRKRMGELLSVSICVYRIARADFKKKSEALLIMEQLNQKIDILQQKFVDLERSVGDLKRSVGQRLDGLEQRFDGLEQRIDGLEQRIDGLEQRIDGLEQRIEGIESKIEPDRNLNQIKSSSFLRVAQLDEGITIFEQNTFTMVDEIGKGNFAQIYKAKYKQNQEEFAIKIPNTGDLIREGNLMVKLNHPNVLELLGVGSFDGKIGLILPLMDASLSVLLEIRKPPTAGDYSSIYPPFNQMDLLCILLELCSGLKYLQEKLIVHRDLAARNCLVKSNGDINLASVDKMKIKLSDFGLSKQLQNSNDFIYFNPGENLPIRSLAPETIGIDPSSNAHFSLASDIWSFGILILEVYNGKEAYANVEEKNILNAIRNGQPEPWLGLNLPPGFDHTKCLNRDENMRPSAKELFKQLKESISLVDEMYAINSVAKLMDSLKN